MFNEWRKEGVYFKLYVYPEKWYCLLISESGEDYSCTSDNFEMNRHIIGPWLANKVYIGYNIKFNDLILWHKIIKLNSDPQYIYEQRNLPSKNWDYWNAFLFLDIIDFGNPYHEYTSKMKDINFINANIQKEMLMDYDILRESINVHKFDVEMKLQFVRENEFELSKSLKTNSNKLTSLSLWNGISQDDISQDGYLRDYVTKEWLDYVRQHVPFEVYTMYTTYSFNQIRQMNKSKEFKYLFEFELFENWCVTGMGGFHSEHLRKFQFNWLDRIKKMLVHDDFKSYYPFLMVIFNTLSRLCHKDKFVKFINDRIWWKENKPDGNEHNIQKVKINAVYGQSLSKSVIKDPNCQASTVIIGQLTLLAYANDCYKNGSTIYQSNTDGLYHAFDRTPENIEKFEKLRQNIERLTGIECERDEVKTYYASTINSYFIEMENGKEEFKSTLFCSDYNNSKLSGKVYPIVQRAMYDWIKYGNDPYQTILNSRDLSEFTLTTFLNNSVEMYFGEFKTKKSTIDDLIINSKYTTRVNKIHERKKDGLLKIDTKYMDNIIDLGNLNRGLSRTIPIKSVKGKPNNTTYVVQKNGTIKKGTRTGKNNALLLDDISSYNFDDFDIDYAFLFKEFEKKLVVKSKDKTKHKLVVSHAPDELKQKIC